MYAYMPPCASAVGRHRTSFCICRRHTCGTNNDASVKVTDIENHCLACIDVQVRLEMPFYEASTCDAPLRLPKPSNYPRIAACAL